MIIKTARIVVAISYFFSLIAIAGSGTGGTGPPAREQLEVMLAMKEVDMGLFSTDSGDVVLGTNRMLEPQLVLSKDADASAALKISGADFEALKSKGVVEASELRAASNSESVISYRVEDGNALGELVLQDRRDLIRRAVQ